MLSIPGVPPRAVKAGVVARLAGGALLLGAVAGAWDANAEEAPSSLEDGAVFAECDGVCPELVVIPEGRFIMGSPETEEGRQSDEGPQRKVAVPRFALSATEITFDQWAACVADGYCQSNPSPNDEGWGRGDRPVITVSWNDIAGEGGFLDWLNWKTTGSTDGPYRLPSEAEWEYAARAGAETRYSFGDDAADLGDYAWYGSNSDTGDGRRTHPVGLKLPNAFGLYDMHGNVWEWVEDCWHGSYNDAPPTGAAWMDANGGNCSGAALRGGSGGNGPRVLRSASRDWNQRDLRDSYNGFRVARTLEEE